MSGLQVERVSSHGVRWSERTSSDRRRASVFARLPHPLPLPLCHLLLDLLLSLFLDLHLLVRSFDARIVLVLWLLDSLLDRIRHPVEPEDPRRLSSVRRAPLVRRDAGVDLSFPCDERVSGGREERARPLARPAPTCARLQLMNLLTRDYVSESWVVELLGERPAPGKG